MQRSLLARSAAEALGTFVVILFGTGVVAMVNLFGRGLPGEIVNGGYTNITVAWGLAVTMGIYLTARVSGAHLNPAVTIALAVFRGFSWRDVLPYCLAQTLGAFFGAAVVFLNYRPAFERFDPELAKSAGVFTTFPAFPAALYAGFVDQVIGTALLLLVILAITDDRNLKTPEWATPILVGLLVTVIGMSFGGLHGYAINPARDFGPRLFTALAGFSHNGLTDGTWQFAVPIIAPLIGGLLGAGAYDLLIRRSLN